MKVGILEVISNGLITISFHKTTPTL